MMYRYGGVLYVQYCHYGELYYTSYKIYSDKLEETQEAADKIASFQ